MTDGMFHDCALMIYLEVEASPEPVEGTPLTRPMWPDSKSCNQFFEHKILVLIGKSKPQDILVISITFGQRVFLVIPHSLGCALRRPGVLVLYYQEKGWHIMWDHGHWTAI